MKLKAELELGFVFGFGFGFNILIILGIDPGTADTGYGGIQINIKNQGSKIKDQKSKIKDKQTPLSTLCYGSIKTKAGLPMQNRLHTLYNELGEVFKKYKPDVVIIERLFFNTNAKTAISVGQARGVVMLLCSQYNCELTEYTALQAKLELTGYGRADKKEMQAKVAQILGIEEKIKPDDAADALAMGICYLSKKEMLTIIK